MITHHLFFSFAAALKYWPTSFVSIRGIFINKPTFSLSLRTFSSRSPFAVSQYNPPFSLGPKFLETYTNFLSQNLNLRILVETDANAGRCCPSLAWKFDAQDHILRSHVSLASTTCTRRRWMLSFLFCLFALSACACRSETRSFHANQRPLFHCASYRASLTGH